MATKSERIKAMFKSSEVAGTGKISVGDLTRFFEAIGLTSAEVESLVKVTDQVGQDPVDYVPILDWALQELRPEGDLDPAVKAHWLAEADKKGQSGKVFANAPLEVRANMEVMLRAVAKRIGNAIQYASDALKADKQLVLAALKGNLNPEVDGFVLEQASKALQDDFEVVLASVTKNGNSIKFASERLRNDKQIVIAALASKPQALQELQADLLLDAEVAKAAVLSSHTTLSKLPEAARTKELASAFYENYSGLRGVKSLQHFPEAVRGDKEILTKALARNPLELQFASAELRNDAQVLHAALQQLPSEDLADRDAAGCFLEFGGEAARDDVELVKEVVRRKWRALRYASERLRDSQEVVLIAVAQSANALSLATLRFRSSLEDVRAAVALKPGAIDFAAEAVQEVLKLEGDVLPPKKQPAAAQKRAADSRTEAGLTYVYTPWFLDARFDAAPSAGAVSSTDPLALEKAQRSFEEASKLREGNGPKEPTSKVLKDILGTSWHSEDFQCDITGFEQKGEEGEWHLSFVAHGKPGKGPIADPSQFARLFDGRFEDSNAFKKVAQAKGISAQAVSMTTSFVDPYQEMVGCLVFQMGGYRGPFDFRFGVGYSFVRLAGT